MSSPSTLGEDGGRANCPSHSLECECTRAHALNLSFLSLSPCRDSRSHPSLTPCILHAFAG